MTYPGEVYISGPQRAFVGPHYLTLLEKPGEFYASTDNNTKQKFQEHSSPVFGSIVTTVTSQLRPWFEHQWIKSGSQRCICGTAKEASSICSASLVCRTRASFCLVMIRVRSTRCRVQDSNLHSLNGHQILSLACLPIPPTRLVSVCLTYSTVLLALLPQVDS